MKFYEKLTKFRKEQNMSQEALAEKLNVSRQAVSKWESGVSYPEMDKLLELCKIFNCTLDQLTNDRIDTQSIKEANVKKGYNKYLIRISSFIEKSVDMFSNMKSIEIVKLIITMLLVSIVISVLQIPINYICNSAETFFMGFGETVGTIFTNLWILILRIAYIILSFSLFIYIYKIKYLDKFNVGESDIHEDTTNQTSSIDSVQSVKKEDISEIKKLGFMDYFARVLIIFVKIMVGFVCIPFIFSLIALAIMLVILVYLIIEGIIFIGPIIGVVSLMIIAKLFLEVMINFIFNGKNKVKRMLIEFLIAVTLTGVGFGISAIEVSKIKFINELPENYELKTYTETVPFTNSSIISRHYYIDYIEDETLTEHIKVEIDYYDDFSIPLVIVDDYAVNIYYQDDEFSMKIFNNIIDNLKDKMIYNYSFGTEYKIRVYSSRQNIETLKQNAKQQLREESELDVCYEEIEELNTKLQEAYEEKETCSETLIDYQNRIQSLIEQ